jgi:hypothetical protein
MKRNMHHSTASIAALSFAVLVSGCSGGGSTTPAVMAPATGVAIANGQVKAKLTIKIPLHKAGTASKSARRSPQYVSTHTLGIGVQTGTTATVSSAPWQLFDVSGTATQSPNASCTTDPASTVRSCVLTVTAPAVQGGTDQFIIDATDVAPLATDTQPNGNILSNANTTETVVEGTANAFSVSLTSVIGSLAMATAAGAVVATPVYSVWSPPGTPANIGVDIIANDIDGGQIFGNPPSFNNPITFSDTLAAASPFTYPSGSASPFILGLPPPQTPGPIPATIVYTPSASITAVPSATVTVSTSYPSYLQPPVTPPATTFTLNAMTVSVGGVPIGSIPGLTMGGAPAVVLVNEANATSFTISDNAAAQAAVRLASNAPGFPNLPIPSTIPAAGGGAAFAVVPVAPSAAGAAPVITITDASGTVATVSTAVAP